MRALLKGRPGGKDKKMATKCLCTCTNDRELGRSAAFSPVSGHVMPPVRTRWVGRYATVFSRILATSNGRSSKPGLGVYDWLGTDRFLAHAIHCRQSATSESPRCGATMQIQGAASPSLKIRRECVIGAHDPASTDPDKTGGHDFSQDCPLDATSCRYSPATPQL